MAELIRRYGSKGANIDELRRKFHVEAQDTAQDTTKDGELPVPGIDYIPPLGAVSIVQPALVARHQADRLAAADYKPWAIQSEDAVAETQTLPPHLPAGASEMPTLPLAFGVGLALLLSAAVLAALMLPSV